MKLGTRITLLTSLLVAAALGIYGLMAVYLRHEALRIELEQQTQSLGRTLQVTLEAALQEGLFEDVHRLLARLQATVQPLDIAYLEMGSGGTTFGAPLMPRALGEPAEDDSQEHEVAWGPPPLDPTRDARLRHMAISGEPYGQHIERGGQPRYTYMIPLRNQQHHIVAALDLTRDEGSLALAMSATRWHVLWTVLAMGLGLAVMVWAATRRAISHPLKRLVEGIDEVSLGDLTRVVLRERDDEIGDLAERFNLMTASLRESRAETERSLEAKIALEAKLRHSDKLATIGLLAANIGHEIGTPLNVIAGRARAMEKKATDPAGVAKNAGIIAVQTERIAKIIQQMLNYSRKKMAERGQLDLAFVVKDVLDFLEHQIALAHVTVRLEGLLVRETIEAGANAHALVVVGDADQLQQVCINLFLNAIQAMPQGGVLSIGCQLLARRKPGLDVAPATNYVVLEVADTGIGIPPENRERIFEPFYSTKENRGTGLGLAVSQGIVKDHDGWIEVEGRADGGTMFKVFLPALDEKVRSPS